VSLLGHFRNRPIQGPEPVFVIEPLREKLRAKLAELADSDAVQLLGGCAGYVVRQVRDGQS
jgi:hypothetical protein